MDGVLSFVEGLTILSFVRFLLTLLLLVYAVFAGLMMKQIGAMTKVVTMKDDFVIRAIGAVHFGLSVVVLLMAIFIL